MGAGRVLEVLKRKYPKRFDLPSENEIRSAITKLFASSKRKAASSTVTSTRQPVQRLTSPRQPVQPSARKRAAESTTEAGQEQPAKKIRVPTQYADFLDRLVIDQPAIMPKDGVEVLRREFPDSTCEITDQQIRAKVSNLKTKHRQAGAQNTRDPASAG